MAGSPRPALGVYPSGRHLAKCWRRESGPHRGKEAVSVWPYYVKKAKAPASPSEPCGRRVLKAASEPHATRRRNPPPSPGG